MAFLLAKEVRSIEDRFYELLVNAPGTEEDKQAFFQRRMKVRIPRTNYEALWERLVEDLGRGGTGEAIFDYVLATADARLTGLLVSTSRRERVHLHQFEKEVVRNLFWGNGRLRRLGQHLLGYIAHTGWLQKPTRSPTRGV